MGKTLQQLTAARSPKNKGIADPIVKMIAEGRAQRARRIERLLTQPQAFAPKHKSQPKPSRQRPKRDR